MNRPRFVCTLAATILSCLCATLVRAVINPGLQPADLYRRYSIVVAGEVESVDSQLGTLSIKITDVWKGDFKTERITLVPEALMRRYLRAYRPGSRIVAFAGNRRRGGEQDFLFYGRTGFGVGEMTSPDRWLWKQDDNEASQTDVRGQEVSTMKGIWDGSVENLAKLIGDIAEGKVFFPRYAYARFREPVVVHRFSSPVRGVALYDVNGDGRLDVFACCETGNKLFLQQRVGRIGNPSIKSDHGGDVVEKTDRKRTDWQSVLQFEDATKSSGLNSVASTSCSLADVNGDGAVDLLAGGKIYLGSDAAAPQLTASQLLPPDANEDVRSSAFVEINGDGFPDVVVSKIKDGLRVYLNPQNVGRIGNPSRNGAFTDATKITGLDQEAAGARLDGFFAPGDWNNDGRTDLFYAAGPGLLLLQDDDGMFSAAEHQVAFDFDAGPQGGAALTGAGCFAPLLHPGRLDLLVPSESAWTWCTNADRELADISASAGEITEASYPHLSAIAEDFNADGYVDYYTVCRKENSENRLMINRGYGVLMHGSKNAFYGNLFAGSAHQRGGWGSAAGDVDNDGDVDLLVGNLHGELSLLLNETLELRKPVDNATDDIRAILNVGIVTARVSGARGVLGARVSLVDNRGSVVGRRDIGSNVSVGCRGPNTVNFAVRNPGAYKLTVRFSDGLVRSSPVELNAGSRVEIDADRDAVAEASTGSVAEPTVTSSPQKIIEETDSQSPRTPWPIIIVFAVVSIAIIVAAVRARTSRTDCHSVRNPSRQTE